MGAALWVSAWSSVGYFSGSHIVDVYAAITRYDKYLVGVLVVLLLAYPAQRTLRARGR